MDAKETTAVAPATPATAAPIPVQAGDTVTLDVIGSPLMSVLAVIPAGHGEPERVRCQWFSDDKQVREECFEVGRVKVTRVLKEMPKAAESQTPAKG